MSALGRTLIKTLKMEYVIRNSFFLAMAIMIALAGCTAEDFGDGKVAGNLQIDENQFSITGVKTSVGSYGGSHGYGEHGYYGGYGGYDSNFKMGYARYITFENKRNLMVMIAMSTTELTSKTYTKNEVYYLGLWHDIFDIQDVDIESVVMIVKKSGKTYDITITGKTKEKEQEFTITYKGTIRKEKDSPYMS